MPIGIYHGTQQKVTEGGTYLKFVKAVDDVQCWRVYESISKCEMMGRLSTEKNALSLRRGVGKSNRELSGVQCKKHGQRKNTGSINTVEKMTGKKRYCACA